MITMEIALDRRTKRSESAKAFQRARRTASFYSVHLRRVAGVIADLVNGFLSSDRLATREDVEELTDALKAYSLMLDPWAKAIAERMIREVAARDLNAWNKLAKIMGVAIGRELQTAPIATAIQEQVYNQVHLITSLPLQAAERVQKLSVEAITTGMRPEELQRRILETGNVTRSRATTIARTEIARAATTLTAARAQYLGATHFIWETSRDQAVRPLHKKLQGKIFAFTDPPVIGENGEKGLPGTIYNCRCYAAPILPEMRGY